MDPVKRQVIIREIEHWRNSKLLPEHYCDFLRNLYIDEEMFPKPKESHFSAMSSWQILKKSLVVFSIICFFLVCSLYFTSFHPVMQIIISLVFVGAIYSIGLNKRQSKPTIAYIYIGLASMLLLFISELIVRVNDWDHASAVICSIAFSGVVWILIGIIARIPLLHFCGWAYMIMAYTMFIQWIHPDPQWYVLQLYTIPVFAALFIWGNKRLTIDRVNGWLLMVIASLFLFIPEVYGFFIDITVFILITGIVCKIISLAMIAWLQLRKTKAKEWITGL